MRAGAGATGVAAALGFAAAALGFGAAPLAAEALGAVDADPTGGAALPLALAPGAVCAAFIMRTSFTSLAIVASGNLKAGMAPLPSLMTRAICSSVAACCHAGSDRFVALSIGPCGPSPRPS